MGLISLVGLWACASDEEVIEAPAPEHEMPIELSASAVRYREAEVATANRRSWTAPDGYLLYDDLYGTSFVNNHSLAQSTIDVFLTHGAGIDTPNPLHARLRYVSSKTNWKLMLPNDVDETAVKKGDYYAYGFIPREAANNAELGKLNPGDPDDPDNSYADGAVLTINGLNTVGYDACVIIGAREGFRTGTEGNYTYYDGNFYTDFNGNGVRDPEEEPLNKHFVNDTPTYSDTYDDGTDTRINRLTAGDFKFYLDTGTTGTGKEEKINPNYLFFLFDHLCSALIINVKVSNDYHALRHIRLKNIYLQTSTDDALTKKTANVTVRLEANESGTNPIQSVDYVYDPTSEEVSGNYVFTSAEGHWLTTDYSDTKLLTHFMPYQVTKLVVTCTYDVYDTNPSAGHPEGNLIRKDCTATNTIPLSLIDAFTEAERGKIYTLNLFVKPTYLYVMSDPDLNNPTVTVE